MSSQKYKTAKSYSEVITQCNSLLKGKKSFRLLDRQLFIYILSQINPHDIDFKLRYRIYVKDFVEMFKKSQKSIYRDVENSINNNFWDREVFYNDYINKAYVRLKWFTYLSYSHDEGFFDIEFSHHFKPFVHQLKKHFSSYKVEDITKFKSTFSISIYEFCVLEINAKRQMMCEFLMEVETIRERLELENKYSDFYDFKRRVLTKAGTEINAHSDLTIEFEEIKKGRRVESIKFIVQRKPGMPRASYAQEENNTESPACPPLVQDGNSAYKCSDTQAISKLSSSDGKVNAVMEESGYKSGSYAQKLNYAQTATKEEIADLAVVSQPQGALPQSQQNKNEASICDNGTNLSNLDAGCKRGYTERQREAIKAARQCGLKQKIAIEEVEGYGSDAVLKVAKKLNAKIAQGHDINNMAGYLRTCLKEDEIVMDSEQYRARLETEEAEKARKAIELEKRWVEFDRYCSKNKDDIVPLLGKIHKNIVLEYHEELFLGDIQSKISAYEDIKKHHQLFTDIFVETDSARHYLKFNQLSSLIFKPQKAGVA